MTKVKNWRLIQGKICILRSFPAERSPSPGTGMNPGGWEILIYRITFRFMKILKRINNRKKWHYLFDVWNCIPCSCRSSIKHEIYPKIVKIEKKIKFPFWENNSYWGLLITHPVFLMTLFYYKLGLILT